MKKSLFDHFLIVQDPRLKRTQKHKLIDIIIIAVCGVISSCETWVEIEEYGNLKKDWFKNFLELQGGIPSHDTFGRVFSLINPQEFQQAFYNWTKATFNIDNNEIIAMDGKYFKSSLTKKGDPRSVVGMVSAWASNAGIALAQKKADFKKSGEKQMITLTHPKTKEKVPIKVFLKQWKEGIANATPLQQNTSMIIGQITSGFGVLWGIVFSMII